MELQQTKQQAGLTLGMMLASMLVVLFVGATTYGQSVMFTSSMDIGSRGANVIALQTYLATRTTYYPEALITGYYGPLTAAAVQRFQCAEEIVCSGSAAATGYGRVGPLTLMQLNLRAGGGVSVDLSGPIIAGIFAATSSNAATVNFSTNEATNGKVYYATSPISFIEAVGKGFAPIVGGTSVMTDGNYRTTHAVTLTGLVPNTVYYYIVQAVDTSGNLSLTWPQSFRTGP